MFSFSIALEQVKAGRKVYRHVWCGKTMWIELMIPDEHSRINRAYLFLNYLCDTGNDQGIRIPWLPSQTDLLSEDWAILPERSDNAAEEGEK